MAKNVDARLQRTQRGQDEIRQKSHTLTQSERLILALIDGLASNDRLRGRVRGMLERRFRLTVADLKAKGFVEEVVLPGNRPESPDSATIESFVRQDPLDPVTLTALTLQPEMISRIVKPAVAQDLPSMEQATILITETEEAESSGVDFYLPLEVQQPTVAETPVFEAAVASNLITANGADQRHSTSSRRIKRARRSRYIQIGYWLLFAGLVCAVILIALMRLE